MVRDPDEAAQPRVSVLMAGPDHLDTLNSQTFAEAEVISWNDAGWHHELANICTRHRWMHSRAADKGEALGRARGVYLVGWDAYEAAPNAPTELVETADRSPGTRGALTANFDPLVLWRRDEFLGRTGRGGLAEADVVAIGGVGGTQIGTCQGV
jgi:hypothetical protein